MPDPIGVVLLDDHPLVLEGLKTRLEKEPDIAVAGTFADPRDLLAQIDAIQADVIVLDISMPYLNGFELGHRLKERYGHALKMIVLSGFTYDEFYHRAYEIGAHAYLSKQSTYAQIINAIRQCVMGYALVPEKAMNRALDPLTPTEREVLRRVAEEKTNKEIARELAMSQRTVEYHLTSITGKLGAKTRIGAVARGYELGLLGAVRDSAAEEER
ncbi:response regulator [Cohnella sp. REN36]|uniref:response regulator transcription factor n=1 Tax=Cohnella sp. REN36 TaxID=2887347 RepID=UPI001D13C686|nr:response regulator transcription factor [Cohnella sp. REN36]MCC3375195.1 response regulator transcription factor [Cohnella sp. REN36]